MTETTLPSAADDLAALAPDAAPVRSVSKRLKTAGIVGTAVAVGFVGVLAVQGSSASPTAAGSAGPPGAAVGGRGPGGPGGFADRGVQGAVQAVSSSSITVAGTTVKVTGATQVVVNGAQGSLADVRKGVTVFVHTEGTGSARFAERIFVGTPPQGGPGGPGGGPGGGPPPAST